MEGGRWKEGGREGEKLMYQLFTVLLSVGVGYTISRLCFREIENVPISGSTKHEREREEEREGGREGGREGPNYPFNS